MMDLRGRRLVLVLSVGLAMLGCGERPVETEPPVHAPVPFTTAQLVAGYAPGLELRFEIRVASGRGVATQTWTVVEQHEGGATTRIAYEEEESKKLATFYSATWSSLMASLRTT